MEVTTSQGDLLTLQLGDTSTGLNLTDVAGLDPVKATLTSQNFATQPGAQFMNAQLPPRNITANVAFDPDPSTQTVKSLRDYLETIFDVASQVDMKFYVDDTDDTTEDGYHISGIVESCESPPFSSSNDIPSADISIMCYEPDFVDPVPVTITTMTTADTDPTPIAYLGKVRPTGVVVTVSVNRAISEFTISYTDPSGAVWNMDFAASLLTGDVVTISTETGNKYANLLRAGVTSSILYAIPPQTTWFNLTRGNGSLRVYTAGAAMPVSVSYSKRFGSL